VDGCPAWWWVGTVIAKYPVFGFGVGVEKYCYSQYYPPLVLYIIIPAVTITMGDRKPVFGFE
jgi:hypothetical protein